MEYQSAYYWRQEERVSLLLQHLVYRKKRKNVLFACVAQCGQEERIVEKLEKWFCREGRQLCLRSERGLEELEQSFLKNHRESLGGKAVTGIVCAGESFMLFSSGGLSAYLLNRRLGNFHLQCLTKADGGVETLAGKMEKDIGILLATKGFFAGAGERQSAECIGEAFIGEGIVDRSRRMEKRLEALGRERERQGGKAVAAVLIKTC